jgi:hypothetical protein
VVLTNETNTLLFFAGRLEWNATTTITNTVRTAVTNNVAEGFFRNASREYYWTVGNGTDGTCNDTGSQFAFDSDIDNGTAGSRTPTTTGVTFEGTATGGWGIFSIARANSALDSYCVAVNTTCNKIYIYKFDKRTDPNFAGCDNAVYLRDSNLIPGDTETLTFNAFIPKGMPSGTLKQGTITVTAT